MSEIPAMVTSVKVAVPPFRMSLLLRSKSAPIALGVLPSKDKVLSKDVVMLLKFEFSFVAEANPAVIVSNVGPLAKMCFPYIKGTAT